MPGALGEFAFVVLMAVAHLRGDGYSATIRAAIQARTRRHVSRGALYITLDRLEAKGLLASALGDPLPQRGGRPRRTYSLTTAGQRALRHNASALARMQAGLEPLLRKS